MSTTNIIPIGKPSYTSLDVTAQTRTDDQWLTVATVTNAGSFVERIILDINTPTVVSNLIDFTISGDLGDTNTPYIVQLNTMVTDTVLVDNIRMIQEDSTGTGPIHVQVQATAIFTSVEGKISAAASPSIPVVSFSEFTAWADLPTQVEIFPATPFANLVAGTGYDTPVEVRDALQTLTGADRLDQDAVKQHKFFADLDPAGGSWIDLVVWPEVTAGGVRNAGGTFTLTCFDSSSNCVFTTELRNTAQRANNITNGEIIVIAREAQYPAATDAVYRMVTDTSAGDSVMRLQFYSGLSGGHRFQLEAYANPELDPTTNVRALAINNSSTVIEIPRTRLDVSRWQEHNITNGSTGGSAQNNIGNRAGAEAWINFEQNVIDLHAGSVIIGKFQNNGTRLSAGEYGDWTAPTSTDWPIDATFFTNLIAEKRPTTGDTTLNPSSTITLSAVDAGGVNAATMTGFDGAHRGLRFTNAGSGGLTMTFANCLYQRVILTLTFGTATSSGGTTQDYEILDSNNVQVASIDIPDNNNEPGDINTFSFEFAGGDGDQVYTLRKRSTGTSQTVYLYNYGMTVYVDEPDLEENVVLQQDSPLRGTLWPRILPSSSIDHPRGSVALNGLAGNRPMWNDGVDWSYFNTTRISNSNITGQFFFAEGNTFNDSGWTGSNHNRLVAVKDHQGFPDLIRCTQTGGTITIQAPGNTQAFWDIARARGFRTDFRMMFGATYDGSVWMDIEPNNTSWGSNGRFEFNVTSNAGQLQITMINSGGNTTFDIDRDVMHTLTMKCDPNSDVADILVEGVKVGEVTYGGGGSTERGTFFYIPPGNAVNDFSFQMITTSTLEAVNSDITLDGEAIRTGLRHNIPNISSPMTIRVPKGLYSFGNTFTVVNGSTETAIIRGLDDDHQLFGGVSEYELYPQKEATFTQTASPVGAVWAVEGGKTIINHNDNVSTGNSLHLVLDSAANIIGRHGNYLGDVTTRRVLAGQYSVQVGILDLPLGTSVQATARNITNEVRDCQYSITLGEVWVDIKDGTGTLTDGQVSVSIWW